MPYVAQDKDEGDDEQGNPDVTLEMDSVGNQYLHLILPANKINFLNGLENNEDTFFNQNSNNCGNDDNGGQFNDNNFND